MRGSGSCAGEPARIVAGGDRPGIVAGIESRIDPDRGGGEAEDLRNDLRRHGAMAFGARRTAIRKCLISSTALALIAKVTSFAREAARAPQDRDTEMSDFEYRARSHCEGNVVCKGSSPSSASSARKVVGVVKWIA